MSITNLHIDAPVGRDSSVRRHADGALDVKRYRLRARRLRSRMLTMMLAGAGSKLVRAVGGSLIGLREKWRTGVAAGRGTRVGA